MHTNECNNEIATVKCDEIGGMKSDLDKTLLNVANTTEPAKCHCNFDPNVEFHNVQMHGSETSGSLI